MANVCIVRHQGHIISKMFFPYQHNFRTLKNYGNKNIDSSLTHLNTCLGYIYNPDTEQEYLNIMNEALKNGNQKNIKK